MKKLMIAAAIVCAAVVSQAASFQWSGEGLKDEAGSEMNGNVGFFFYGSDTGSAVTPWTQEAAIAAVLAMGPGIPDEMMGFALVGEGGAVMGGQEDVTVVAGEKIGGFMVMTDVKMDDLVFDDGGSIIGGFDPTQYSVIAGGEGGTVTIDGALDNTYSFGFGAAQQGEWQSVPEPTSGLLLLIGVAGLALRRRRA